MAPWAPSAVLVRSSGAVPGALQGLNQSVDILFVGGNDDVLHGFEHFRVIERAFPVQQGARLVRLQRDGECEEGSAVMPDHNFFGGLQLEENALIGIAGTVGRNHGELPPAPGFKLEDLEFVAEPVRAPPRGQGLAVGKGAVNTRRRKGDEPFGLN